MYSNNRYDGIDPRIVSIISKKARRLIKHRLFFPHEVEDIQQELINHLITQLRHYKPSEHALFSFAEKVITNKVNKIILHKSRKKRGGDVSICSLYEFV